MLKQIIPLILFFLLTPGILWTYSKKHNKYSIAILHASLFAFVFYLIESYTPIREGMQKIKGITFKLEKSMETDDVRKKLRTILEKARKKYGNKLETSVTFDNNDGENDLSVSILGRTSSRNTSKEEIMDKDAKEIFKFIEKVKNKKE